MIFYFLVYDFTGVVPRARLSRLTISSCLSPAQSESEKTVTSELMFGSIVSLPSSTERVASFWKCYVVQGLTFFGTTRARRMLCLLCLDRGTSIWPHEICAC